MKQLSDKEIQEMLAAETERQVKLNDARKAIDADNNFMAKVALEKEYRQDIKDKDEQDARGNRVTHASMVLGDLFPLFVFLIIAAGMWAFVKTYIVPISGW